MSPLPLGWRAPRARTLVQLAFVVLTLVAVFLVRGNAEAWCPFGGIETVHAWVVEGNALCSVGVTNLYVVVAVLLSLLLLRRAFCSHVCPVGSVSEWMHRLGRKVGLASLAVPGRLDAVLASLKYVVLVVVLFFTWQASELVFRGYCPAYALLGRHGEDITFWAYVISGGILLLSVVVTVPFCRWLCPLAAVMNPLSRFGLARVRRDAGACIDCGKCARACPMGIPVHAVDTVTHARCTTCLDCVDACPTRGRRTLAWRLPGPRRRVLPRGALTGVLLLLLGGAVAFAHFLPLPSFRWSRGEASPETAVLELAVHDLSCRGRANLLVYYLERDDDLALPGSIRLEAWPGPGAARARVVYDPAKVDADLIRMAITEPYYDYGLGTFRMSPFQIEGYDPLAPLPAPAEGGP